MNYERETTRDPTNGASPTLQRMRLKRGLWLGVTVVALLAAMVTTSAAASADPPPKVAVCHVDDDGVVKLKSFSGKAVAKHLAHGDGLPGSPVPGVAGYEYDASCAVVATDSDGDGVPDLFDTCPGFDDLMDTDGDGIADGCDPTPNGDPPDDCGGFANIQVPSDVALYDDCEVLDGVYLHITSGVTDVTLPALKTVNTYVYFHQNSDVVNVSMPLLESVGEYVYFHQNPALQSLDMRSLSTVGRYLYFHQNTQLSAAALGNLDSVNDYVYFVGNTSLCPPKLDWPNITPSVTISGNDSPCP